MPPRPQRNSHDTIELYARLVLRRLGMIENEANVRDLVPALCYSADGYARGVALEEMGWVVDASTVRVLADRALHDQALAECVAAWVLANGVRFPAKEGDVVSCGKLNGYKPRAVVRGVFRSTAEALVEVEAPDPEAPPELVRITAEDVRSVTGPGGVIRNSRYSRMADAR